jgi:hypothetical protein
MDSHNYAIYGGKGVNGGAESFFDFFLSAVPAGRNASSNKIDLSEIKVLNVA